MMARKRALSADDLKRVGTLRNAGESYRSIARELKVSSTTIARAVNSKIRTADEFTNTPSVTPPRRSVGPLVWDLERIRAARDQQSSGKFKLPVGLAEAIRTDDALYVAYHNRIAPHSAVAADLVPHASSRGEAAKTRAAKFITIPRSVLKGIHGTMVNHGVGVGYVDHVTNDSGTVVEFVLREWPLEHVYYDTAAETLMTATHNGAAVPITHGDGHWVVFKKFKAVPWLQEACLLPAALLWPAHANSVSDWASATTAHGLAKIIGMLPEGVALQDKDGNLTEPAQQYLATLNGLVSGESGAGIVPSGAETEFLSNNSTAWQVFSEMINGREKAAARIYLGTDALLGSVGGAPGVDISALFGIATTIVQGDFEAIQTALYTGVYAPWTAINMGDSSYAPGIKYDLPDPDEEGAHEESAKNEERFTKAIAERRAQKLEITEEVIEGLAKKFGITPVPKLTTPDVKNSSIVLPPTDVARVTRVGEARASQGLPLLGDERDDLFVSELEAFNVAAAEAEGEAAAGTDAAPTPEPT